MFNCITKRKARKEHECEVCGKTINKGEMYNHRTANFESIITEKWCENCDAIVKEFWHKMHKSGDDLYDNLWEGISEDMRELSCYDCPNKEICEIENITTCDKCRKDYGGVI